MNKILVALVLLLLVSLPAQAIDCVAGCDGHDQLSGSVYPFMEDVNDAWVSVVYGGGYATIVQGCSSRNYVNFSHTQPVNAVFRAFIKVREGTAPVGAHFAIRFTIDGNPVAQYIRAITGQYPQTEDVNVVVPSLAQGDHQVRVQMWLYEGSGSLLVTQAMLSGNGAPPEYGSGSIVNANVMTVDGTWRQITDTLSFTASTDVNLLVQGYFQINSGTTGQKLAVGFSLDGASSQHTMEIGVPLQMPTGINIFDHYKSKPGFLQVPAGPHTLSLWAINRDGGSATVQYRQVEVIGFAANDDTKTLMKESPVVTTPVVVTTSGDGSVVCDPHLLWCTGTQWTKLLEFTYPQVTPLEQQNMVGEAYIEFTGTSDQQPKAVEVGVEAIFDPQYDFSGNPICPPPVPETTADFTVVIFEIPGSRHQKFVWMHPLLWGTQKPNLVRLFVRPVCGYPGNFTVEKRFMALKAIPTTGATACYKD